jgi:phosphoglycolate phosphatase-like HAD superfamily hydrolase
VSNSARSLAIDLDGALGDTRSLWDAWLEAAGSVLGVRAEEMPADRGQAARELDECGAGNWRDLLERFAEDRVAVHVRRDASTSSALRLLRSRATSIGVFTDAPEELARVVLRHLGADRRVDAIETGAGALERLLARLGPHAVVLRTREDLLGTLDAL